MGLKLYNTLTREKELFKSLEDGRVRMYACGPTVYDVPHIGHARSAYVFDIMRKYLEKGGREVEFVRNVTDIDDKIIDRARAELKEREPSPGALLDKTREVAARYLDSYLEQMDRLGIGEPASQPKATENIAEVIEAVQTLVAKGNAYVSGGDVYFDVSSFDDYGKLSGRNSEELRTGGRVDPAENKRSALDFALWKSSSPGEPSWPSPWGQGRPGWHIECSVMSTCTLGASFDIHGGGLDLIFPHHENEIAQAEALTGRKFANWWVHHGLLTVKGEKMSKSLGNFITVEDFFNEYGDADILKLLFLSTHYRKAIDCTPARFEEARRIKERFVIFIDKALSLVGEAEGGRVPDKLSRAMTDAMDDDLNTPSALKVLMDSVREGNEILMGKGNMTDERRVELSQHAAFINSWAVFFGLNLKPGGMPAQERRKIEDLVALREEARREKDYATGDRIRDQLNEMGIAIEDTPEGTVWRKS